MSLEAKRAKVPWLAGVLILSQLLVGLSGVWFLERSYQLYSGIVGVEAHCLNFLQALTLESANVHRSCLDLLLAESPGEFQSAQAKIAGAWKRNDELLEKIGLLSQIRESKHLWVELRDARNSYAEACERFTNLVTASRRAQALADRTDRLRPAFEAYQAAQTALANQTDLLATQAAMAASTQTRQMEKVLLGLTTWPLALSLGLFLVFAVLLIKLAWMCREDFQCLPPIRK